MSIGGSTIVFVGGVHGVGKSTLCATAARRGGYVHLAASAIIRAQKQFVSETGSKAVADIRSNQDFLLAGLRATVESGRQYILDGHLALWETNGTPTRVPLDVFREISPNGIVLVLDSSDAIARRLTNRDGRVYRVDQVDALQKLEIEHGRAVAQRLGVPIVEVSKNEHDDFLAIVHTALTR